MTRDDSQRGEFVLTCPLPLAGGDTVTLAHGGGGRRMSQLLEGLLFPAFESEPLKARHDGAAVEVGGQQLAFTTDSFVVRPLFFPGGDIGTLAVYGTVNDLAMCGARPLYLSVGLILEEGLSLESLRRIAESMRRAADRTGVQFATGDTKVVDAGKGDQVFINTSGVGIIEHDRAIRPDAVEVGDAVLLSGDVGRHGMAIMAVREGLEFESAIESDCGPLWEPVAALLEAGIEIHCLRDCTRGGVASALVEIAEASRRQIDIDLSAVPVREDVRGACEILGLDPLYVANEGRLVAFVPDRQVDRALELLRRHEITAGACRLGQVVEGRPGLVSGRTAIGTRRVIDMLSGEQLPRIC
jgi:hydrogenase expression/formation protein HypE